MKTTRKKQGFTLIELMVTLGISLTALGGVISTIQQIGSGVINTTNQVSLNEQFQSLLDHFYQKARAVSAIHVSLPNSFEFTYLKGGSISERLNYTWDEASQQLIVSEISELSDGTLVTTPSSTKVPFTNVQFTYYNKFGDEVETVFGSNINVNAVKVSFTQQDGTHSQEVVQSPIIMFRNKSLI